MSPKIVEYFKIINLRKYRTLRSPTESLYNWRKENISYDTLRADSYEVFSETLFKLKHILLEIHIYLLLFFKTEIK